MKANPYMALWGLPEDQVDGEPFDSVVAWRAGFAAISEAVHIGKGLTVCEQVRLFQEGARAAFPMAASWRIEQLAHEFTRDLARSIFELQDGAAKENARVYLMEHDQDFILEHGGIK